MIAHAPAGLELESSFLNAGGARSHATSDLPQSARLAHWDNPHVEWAICNGPDRRTPSNRRLPVAASGSSMRGDSELEGLNLKSASSWHPRTIYASCVPVAQGSVLIDESLNAPPKPCLQQTLKMVVRQSHGGHPPCRTYLPAREISTAKWSCQKRENAYISRTEDAANTVVFLLVRTIGKWGEKYSAAQ
jgi:hypothetical protein